MKVRLLSHGPLRGRYNMAVDEAIHNAYQRGEAGPTLRFYRWEPACLSLGRFQDVAKEVNLQGLKDLGIDLVRRATGGKAVLHDDELTYSIVISESLLPGSILETYQELSKALVNGLKALGIPAELSALEHGVTARDDRFKQAACFSAPSWYEIVACGKKVTGSAQVRKGGVILQHGSIPLAMDFEKLAGCLSTRSEGHAKRVESVLSKKAAGLSQVCGRSISCSELEKQLVTAFETTFNWALEEGSLTPDEIQEAVKLSRDKYGADSWTMKRTGSAVHAVT
ncbi:MAG TPA: lipoate--protein ligase family protein [Firmicutes bacterium]|nr:lipoate--protein ligase family protein [Candidatus Fermentithermobacillaceae bacterium]